MRPGIPSSPRPRRKARSSSTIWRSARLTSQPSSNRSKRNTASPSRASICAPANSSNASGPSNRRDVILATSRLGMTTLYVTHDQSEAMALSDRVVVMDQGRIQQVGAPEDIYRYPVNRTVAGFFGNPNLLDASVAACARLEGDRVQLDVVGQGWAGRCESATEVPPGQTVTVMVRPEDI